MTARRYAEPRCPGVLTQEAKPLAYRNAALQKKAANLIDHGGPLTDQARSHAVQGLQIQLIVGLYRNATCRWPLHSFRDRAHPGNRSCDLDGTV